MRCATGTRSSSAKRFCASTSLNRCLPRASSSREAAASPERKTIVRIKMAECSACGARYAPGEHFCGNCGAQLIPKSPELMTMSATLGDEVDAPALMSAQLATTVEDAETRETPIGDDE